MEREENRYGPRTPRRERLRTSCSPAEHPLGPPGSRLPARRAVPDPPDVREPVDALGHAEEHIQGGHGRAAPAGSDEQRPQVEAQVAAVAPGAGAAGAQAGDGQAGRARFRDREPASLTCSGVAYPLETAFFQWEQGARRVREADTREVNRRLNLVLDELRRRLGSTFTAEELADHYGEGTGWADGLARLGSWVAARAHYPYPP